MTERSVYTFYCREKTIAWLKDYFTIVDEVVLGPSFLLRERVYSHYTSGDYDGSGYLIAERVNGSFIICRIAPISNEKDPPEVLSLNELKKLCSVDNNGLKRFQGEDLV